MTGITGPMAMTIWISTAPACSRNGTSPHVTQLGDLPLNGSATTFQINKWVGHKKPPVSLAYHSARFHATKKENSRIITSKSHTPCSTAGWWFGHPSTPDQVARYRGKISGPLLDRIDIQIEVPAVPREVLLTQADGEASSDIQARVEAARQRSLLRQNKPNAQLTVPEIDALCAPDAQGAALLQQAITRFSLSARAYHRVLKVARSIADLAASENILTAHIAEAVQYRRMDRNN